MKYNKIFVFLLFTIMISDCYSQTIGLCLASQKILSIAASINISKEEEQYNSFCSTLKEIEDSGDKGKILELRNNILDYGQKNATHPFGARSILLAADLTYVYLNDISTSEKYFREVFEIFKNNINWEISQKNISYVGQRVGDLLYRQNKNKEALEIWKNTFFQYPENMFSMQLVSKVINCNNSIFHSDVSWKENVNFCEKALKVINDKRSIGQLEIERLYVLIDATENKYISAQELIKEIDVILSKYKQGENEKVDSVRAMLLHIKDEFKAKNPLEDQIISQGVINEYLINLNTQPLTEKHYTETIKQDFVDTKESIQPITINNPEINDVNNEQGPRPGKSLAYSENNSSKFLIKMIVIFSSLIILLIAIKKWNLIKK